MQKIFRHYSSHLLAIGVFIAFATAITTSQNAQAVDDVEAPMTLHSNATTAPKPQFVQQPTNSSNELYSETYYQNVGSGAASQIRLRREWPVSSTQASIYFGAVLERNLNAQASAPLIQNATSPEVGVLYRPFGFLTTWAEYRYRIVQTMGSSQVQGNTNDPRAGLAAGKLWNSNKTRLNGEIYSESIWIPRFSSSPVVSGFARGAYAVASFRKLVLSAYTELNEFSSPSLTDLGPSRAQLRAGARGSLQYGSWSGSLFLYRPWQFASLRPPQSEGLEGLFVLGGRF